MPRQVDWHRIRIGLVVALILVVAGVVIDSLFSASWALDDALLLAVAALIGLALLLTRGRGESEASSSRTTTTTVPRTHHHTHTITKRSDERHWLPPGELAP